MAKTNVSGWIRPRRYESEFEYQRRTMPIAIKEGLARNAEQAAAKTRAWFQFYKLVRFEIIRAEDAAEYKVPPA